MDKKIAGLLGAVAALATMNSAHSATPPAVAPAEALQASSYAELLAPIPNAVALLSADNAARAQTPTADDLEGVQIAQGYYHHHHHHHHHHYRRYRHHHHHHHHHHGAFIGVPGVGGVVVR